MRINWTRIARETDLLRRADLSGADLDFSCLPLWCGGLNIQIDARLARQFLYHALAQKCNDADYQAIIEIEAVWNFVNEFHRIKSGECKPLMPKGESK